MSFLSGLTATDFQQKVQDLLQRGRALPRTPDALLPDLIGGISDPMFSVHQAAVQLLEQEADPAYTVELLPDWELDYGLPDPCTPLNPTLDQRRVSLLAKIAASPGGQSIDYYVGVAAALGFVITITESHTFRLGVSHFGDLLCGPGWQFVWQINAPSITVDHFRFGISAFGEPFWTIGNTELQCRLSQIMPAHTILLFSYS